MTGNPEIIAALNSLLPNEKAAHLIYWQQSRIAANLGYPKFAVKLLEESAEELGHAEKLADRVLLLDGMPTTSVPDVEIGTEIPAFLAAGLAFEKVVHAAYEPVIARCLELNDGVTRELLEGIQEDTEGHIHWLETQLSLLQDLGPANYLQMWV